MYSDKTSLRSSLTLIGIVIALSALIGLSLPLLSDNRPAGSDSVAEAWFTPAATATRAPTPTAPPSPTAAVVEELESASGSPRSAYVVLDTVPPVPQLPIRQPLPAELAATPETANVARQAERMATPTAVPAELVQSYPHAADLPHSVAVQIPVARGPNDALALTKAVAAEPPISPTSPAVARPGETVSALFSQPSPPARRLDAAPARTAVPTPQPTQVDATAPQFDRQPTPKPQSPTVTGLVAPELISPPPDARLAGKAIFEWRPAEQLAHGQAYEIVVWSPDQDPGQARGIAPATMMTSQEVNLDPLFESGQFRMGNLYWTVLVVQREPYLRLTAPGQSEARYLVRRTGG